jgi:toxin ParE1/3/4
MIRYVLSPRAQADIDDIWDYTAHRWNEDQAQHYVEDIRRAVETIAHDPRRGRPCDQIRRGYLRFSVNAHVLFYRISAGGGIEVVRVLHQSMDFGRHL